MRKITKENQIQLIDIFSLFSYDLHMKLTHKP